MQRERELLGCRFESPKPFVRALNPFLSLLSRNTQAAELAGLLALLERMVRRLSCHRSDQSAKSSQGWDKRSAGSLEAQSSAVSRKGRAFRGAAWHCGVAVRTAGSYTSRGLAGSFALMRLLIALNASGYNLGIALPESIN